MAHKVHVNPELAHQEEGITITSQTVGTPFHLPCTCFELNQILHSLELEEDGVRISLTVVDTPGFGDQIDNEFTSVAHPPPVFLAGGNIDRRLIDLILTRNRFGEIVGYLERQYDDILSEESRIKRNPRFRDNRVHALLYFITPTGHSYVPPFQLHIISLRAEWSLILIC